MTDTILLVIIAVVLIVMARTGRTKLDTIQHTVNSDRDRMLAKIDALLATNESLHEEIRRLVSASEAGRERGIQDQKDAHRTAFRQPPPPKAP